MRTDKLSYQQVAEWFKKARNPDVGRPVRSWGRLYKVDENYELRLCTTVVGVFTPDNKFTFKMSSQDARNCSVTLSQVLQRTIPFVWVRKGMGRYVVKPTPPYEEYKKSNPYAYYWQYFSKQEGYEVFDGLCFDLNTYQPINARPPITKAEIDSDNKLVWLRQLRKFKTAVKVRARMGIIETLIQQVDAERGATKRHDWKQPDWSSDTWQEVLYTAIKDSECPTELLKGIIKSVPRGYYNHRSITLKEVIDEGDRICTTYSLDLRKRFGVFKGV